MSLTANVYLEINNTTKKIRVVDATNYTEEGIDLAALSAKGLGILTAPTGAAIYNGSTVGSPLVNLTSTTTSSWFDLPLDNNGAILNGTYSFTYNLRYAISDGVINSIDAPSTAEVEFTWAGRVLIEGDSVVFAGNSDSANNGTFTVDSVSFDEGSDNSTIIFTQTTLVTDATPDGTYSFDVTRSNFAGTSVVWNGCDLKTLAVTITVDCDSTQYGSLTVQDTTDYSGQTLISRPLSVYYPNGLTPAPTTDPLTTTSGAITVNAIATGTWTYTLVSNLSVTQDDGLVYTYQATTGAQEFVVSCAGTLCGLTPCIESIKDKYYTSYQKGVASGLEPLILMITQLVGLAKEYKICGNSEMYASTVTQLESVLDESGQCSCGCCDESAGAQWIDNGGLDSQTVLEDLYDQVQELATTVGYNPTTLYLTTQFYGYDDGFDNTPASFDDLDNITIPSSYLDFPTTDGAFGKKAIIVEIDAQTISAGGQVYVGLVNGTTTDILAQGIGAGSDGVADTVHMVLRVQKSGSDYLLWALINQKFFNLANAECDSQASNAYFTNVLASGDDIVLNIVPQLAGADIKTTYTKVEITAIKTVL